MSEPERIGESEFLKELNRLHAERLGETDSTRRAMLTKQIAALISNHAHGVPRETAE